MYNQKQLSLLYKSIYYYVYTMQDANTGKQLCQHFSNYWETIKLTF